MGRAGWGRILFRSKVTSKDADMDIARGVIDQLGCDPLVISTDYPHVDSRFPDAIGTSLKLPFSDDAKRKILWDNCAAYYGIR